MTTATGASIMTGEAPESKVISTDTDNEEPSSEPDNIMKEDPVATGEEDMEEKVVQNNGITMNSNHANGTDGICDKIFPSRFPLWYALTVFSAVSLISLCTETNPKEWFAEEKFLLFVTVFSLMISSVACMGNIVKRENFVGQPLEGLWLFTALGLWVGGLIVMMDTENLLAVDAAGDILNANLYFFSWASLISTVSLLVAYGFQVNDATMLSSNAQSAGYWAGICVASLVAFMSAIQTLAKGETMDGLEYDCAGDSNDRGTGYCERLKFSISLGAIGTVVAGICSLLTFKMSNELNGLVSFVMLFGWTLGVAFATFGEKSPANRAGNLYFSSWAAFVMSLFMVSTSVKNYLATNDKRPPETKNEKLVSIETDRPEEAPGQPEKEAEVSSQSEGILFPSPTLQNREAPSDVDSTPEKVPVESVDVPSQA